ncbi:MAG: hypothetical protein ACOYM3_22700, partial [Terrimicrobiaceae bacterium]
LVVGSSPTQPILKQLHLATQQMSLDHAGAGNPVQWTCSNTTPLTLEDWKKAISPEYLSETDLKKMLSVKVDRRFFGNKIIGEGFNVFAVTASDPEETVLFATKNWHGPKEKELSGDPYGSKAFVVFRKGTSGLILQQRQATNLPLLGGGGMHGYLPLR